MRRPHDDSNLLETGGVKQKIEENKMCNFFSCIITKDFTVLWNKDTDAHEELIKDNKLNDSLKVGNGSRTWMKAEITPKDGDIFNHAPENWEIKIDEQITEQWYLRNKTQYDKAMSHALMGCLSEMFITTGTTENITNGRWFVGGSATIKCVRGSATIQDVRDSATIKASGQSTIIKRTKSDCKVEIHEEAMLISRYKKEIEINTQKFSWKQKEE